MLDNDGQVLILELEKRNQQEWWSCVCVGDAEIDTTALQPEESRLSDLDGDTRGAVEKMMFDQRQRAIGMPTSDETQRANALSAFMREHPEMDFSQLDASTPTMMNE